MAWFAGPGGKMVREAERMGLRPRLIRRREMGSVLEMIGVLVLSVALVKRTVQEQRYWQLKRLCSRPVDSAKSALL